MSVPPAIPEITRGKHDRTQREAAFIEAATQVFAEKGYDCATTREVAERAGCAEGLIHRYFGGKRGLLLAVLRGKGERSGPALRAAVPDSEDLRADIAALVDWSLDYAWENRDFMRVSVPRAVVDHEVGRFVGSVMHRQRVAVIEEKLRRHQRAGRVRPDVDIQSVAEGIAGLTFAAGFFSQVVFGDDRAAVRRAAAEMAGVIARGISAC